MRDGRAEVKKKMQDGRAKKMQDGRAKKCKVVEQKKLAEPAVWADN
jgi:hypothetical protein